MVGAARRTIWLTGMCHWRIMNRSITPLIIVTVIFVSHKSRISWVTSKQTIISSNRKITATFSIRRPALCGQKTQMALFVQSLVTHAGAWIMQKAVRGKVVLLFTMISLAWSLHTAAKRPLKQNWSTCAIKNLAIRQKATGSRSMKWVRWPHSILVSWRSPISQASTIRIYSAIWANQKWHSPWSSSYWHSASMTHQKAFLAMKTTAAWLVGTSSMPWAFIQSHRGQANMSLACPYLIKQHCILLQAKT